MKSFEKISFYAENNWVANSFECKVFRIFANWVISIERFSFEQGSLQICRWTLSAFAYYPPGIMVNKLTYTKFVLENRSVRTLFDANRIGFIYCEMVSAWKVKSVSIVARKIKVSFRKIIFRAYITIFSLLRNSKMNLWRISRTVGFQGSLSFSERNFMKDFRTPLTLDSKIGSPDFRTQNVWTVRTILLT